MITTCHSKPAGNALVAVLAASTLILAGVSAAFAQGTPASQPTPVPAPTSRPSPHGAGMPKSPHGAASAMPPSTTPAVPPPPVRPILRGATPVKTLTLRAFHRVFHEFVDDNTVAMYKAFPIGDTEFTAEVVEYVPDFALNLKTREILSRSDKPNNPAVRVLVLEKGVPQDTVWAMLNMPPHFARNSLLAFQIRRLELKDHAPIVTPDAAPVPQGTTKPAAGQKAAGTKQP